MFHEYYIICDIISILYVCTVFEICYPGQWQCNPLCPVRFFVKSGPNYVMGLEHDVGDINKGTDDQCSIRDQCRDPMSAPKPKEDNGCSNEIDNKYVLLSEKCAFVFINFNPL